MAWIYRKADQHGCPIPPLEPRGGENAQAGDLWRCDHVAHPSRPRADSGCGALYRVIEDQRNGLYFERVPDDKVEAMLRARGLTP